MPEAASSMSARTMASRISGATVAMNSDRNAASSALSDIVLHSSLDLGDAAVDVKLDSSDVTRFVRCKEGNSLGNLVRVSQSAQWNVLGEIVLHLRQGLALLPGVEDWRIDVARADRVHANAAVFQLSGPGASERADRRLSSTVNTDR